MPEFTASKSMVKEVERVRVEIGGGAPFTSKILKEKKSRQARDGETVKLEELLQPLKKARTQPKRKAAPKSKASAKPSVEKECLEDIEADVGQGEGTTRARWWIDDLLACLVHAAGALTGDA